MEFKTTPGVIALLSKADNCQGFKGTKYFFKGDLNQISTAETVATDLGCKVLVEGHIPFVTSSEDFKKVVDYLISHSIEGWFHYVTYEEMCDIKKQYYFNGRYLNENLEILEIARYFNISVAATDSNLLYAHTREDFTRITKRFNEKFPKEQKIS